VTWFLTVFRQSAETIAVVKAFYRPVYLANMVGYESGEK
jgi:hypothetical protein